MSWAWSVELTASRRQPRGFSLADVSVRLGGRRVLRGVDLTVEPGEAVAILGPSGAGKTTLLRLLNGAVVPELGTVTVAGRDLSMVTGRALREVRSGIGFIHQDLRLVPNLRVVQNVLMGRFGGQSFASSLRMMFKSSEKEQEEVHRLLERVGIVDKMFDRVDTLSGGQAQRVAVARALYQRPGILLADEPVSSVDPARAHALLALLGEICAEEGLTLGVSVHDPDLVRRHFDRVVGLREGAVVFDGPTDRLDEATLADLYRLDTVDEL